jgi:hypothetical protein
MASFRPLWLKEGYRSGTLPRGHVTAIDRRIFVSAEIPERRRQRQQRSPSSNGEIP